MTCIVGYIDKKKIWMGADSLGSDDNRGWNIRTRKIVKKGEMLIGNSGTYKQINILRWSFTLPERPSRMSATKFMNTLFIDAIRKRFKDAGFAKIKDNVEEFDGALLIGYRGQLFEIDSEYQVVENNEHYASMGCACEIARGALHVLDRDKKLTPRQKILKALQAAAEHDNYVKPPFHIRSL